MYRGGTGFTLEDNRTKTGGEIKCTQDIITALKEGYPIFSTVTGYHIGTALYSAVRDRKHYRDIDDLAQFVIKTYL